MHAYESDPEANHIAFVDSWFRTGDQGYLDSEGYLYITGRLKDMTNRGGEKVFPREIEEALVEHPCVLEAVAFSVSHPTLGEDLAAAVVITPGSALTESVFALLLLSAWRITRFPARCLLSR